MGSGASPGIKAAAKASSEEELKATLRPLAPEAREKLLLALKGLEEPAASAGATKQPSETVAENTPQPSSPVKQGSLKGLRKGFSRKSVSREVPPLEKVHSAVRWGKTPEELEALMRDVGLSMEDLAKNPDERNGNRALHIAAQNGHIGLVRFLLSNGADVNCQNGKGQTPLHMSVEYDFYFQSKVLLAAGAQKDIMNADGNPAILGIDGKKVMADTWDSPMNVFKATRDDSAELEEAFAALEQASRSSPDLLDREGLEFAGRQKKDSFTAHWDEKRFQAILAVA